MNGLALRALEEVRGQHSLEADRNELPSFLTRLRDSLLDRRADWDDVGGDSQHGPLGYSMQDESDGDPLRAVEDKSSADHHRGGDQLDLFGGAG